MRKAFIALILVAVLAIIASPMLARSPQHPRHVADLSFVGLTDRAEVVFAHATAVMPALRMCEAPAAMMTEIPAGKLAGFERHTDYASMRTIGSRPRDQNRYTLRC